MSKKETVPDIPSYIVVARKDGRGGIKPFGSYGKRQAGATVEIGNNTYKVGKDGRVNIPKKIMDKFGENNKDGRKVIQVGFRTEKIGKPDYWKNVKAQINEPAKDSLKGKTGEVTIKYKPVKKANVLNPKDAPDFYEKAN